PQESAGTSSSRSLFPLTCGQADARLVGPIAWFLTWRWHGISNHRAAHTNVAVEQRRWRSHRVVGGQRLRANGSTAFGALKDTKLGNLEGARTSGVQTAGTGGCIDRTPAPGVRRTTACARSQLRDAPSRLLRQD